jgi:hypothetical protein
MFNVQTTRNVWFETVIQNASAHLIVQHLIYKTDFHTKGVRLSVGLMGKLTKILVGFSKDHVVNEFLSP